MSKFGQGNGEMRSGERWEVGEGLGEGRLMESEKGGERQKGSKPK